MAILATILTSIIFTTNYLIPRLSYTALTAPDVAPGDAYGYAVALSGNGERAIVGAPFSDSGEAFNSGSIYIFNKASSWKSAQEISSPTRKTGQQFGKSLSISEQGSTLVVGSNRGAYIYSCNSLGCVQKQALSLTIGVPEEFGKIVKITQDGSVIAVGTKDKVFIFKKIEDVWRAAFKLSCPRDDCGDFPASLAISGDGNVIAIGELGLNEQRGAVHIYTKSGSAWKVAQNIQSPNTNDPSRDVFGASTSISADGNTLIIGGSSDSASHIYRTHKDGWTHRTQLFPKNLALREDGLIFTVQSSITDNGNITYFGISGGYDGTGRFVQFSEYQEDWRQIAEYPDPRKIEGRNFGHALSSSANGSVVLIGASEVFIRGSTGQAYLKVIQN